MTRESTTTLVVLSVLGGFVATGLTMATNAGIAGVYVFSVLATFAVVVFMGWADVRARFAKDRGRQRHPRVL